MSSDDGNDDDVFLSPSAEHPPANHAPNQGMNGAMNYSDQHHHNPQHTSTSGKNLLNLGKK